MAYRNIFIESDCRLSTRDNLLIIKKEVEHTIPLEDINSIVIDSVACNISSKLLSRITEHNIILYICNDKHLPKSILLSTNSYSRKLKRLTMQLELPKPLIKRMWQKIIIQKVYNQGTTLKLLNLDGSDKLFNLSLSVQSGDNTNVEATAAAYYFKMLFGEDFTRRDDMIYINASLDYAYSIVRSMICRTLIAYGLEPCIGLFHHSELNNFNLADDIIEVFRPLVDLYIASNITKLNKELDSSCKKILLNVTNQLVLMDNKRYNIQTAIEEVIISLVSSIKEENNVLKLPTLISLKEYSYE